MIQSPKLMVLFGLLASCAYQAKNPVPPTEQELSTLFEMLPGKYAGEAPQGMAPGGKLQMLVHSFTPVTAPQLGSRLLYYQVTRGSAKGPILQAKIFVFALEADRPANSMHALVLDPVQAEALRIGDTADWQSLSRESLMSFPDTCFFTWTRQGKGFLAEGSNTCSYASRAFGQTIKPDMRYRITGDVFELEETLLGEDGNAIVATGGPLVATRI